jgi:hypothetical protein
VFFLFGFPFVFFLPIFLLFLAVRAGLWMLRPPEHGRHGVIGSAGDERELLAQYYAGGYAHRYTRDRQVQLFKLAFRLGGRLTVSDIVIETGLGVQEAEAVIEAMVDNTHVNMEVNDDGMVVYEFPEIIARMKQSGPQTP